MREAVCHIDCHCAVNLGDLDDVWKAVLYVVRVNIKSENEGGYVDIRCEPY
jgi:hypothetical protein